MIFIAVGTQKFQLDRLLRLVDKLVAQKRFDEEVFAQIGNSDYEPRNYKYVRFLHKEEFENRIKECEILITHSGVATIIAGLQYGKKIIVVPRLAKYGEHVDNHQVQIADCFFRQNLVMMYSENDDLAELVEKARRHIFSKYISQKKQTIGVIREYLKSICNDKGNY